MRSAQWYCSRNKQKAGPFSTPQLQQLAQSGKLQREDMLLEEGTSQWVAARTIPGLFPSSTPNRRLWPWVAAVVVFGLASGFGVKALLNRDDKPREQQDAKLDPLNETPRKKDEVPPVLTSPGNKDVTPPVQTDPEKKEELPSKGEVKQPEEPKPDPVKAKREEDFQRYLRAGNALQEAKQFDAAIKALNEAINLIPENAEALAALKAAEKARADAIAAEDVQREKEQRLKAFNLLLEAGRANLARNQFDVAVLALNEALKLVPDHEEALAALRLAEKGRQVAANAAAEAERKQRLDAYLKWINNGRHALFTLRKYDVAIKDFTEAQKLFPGDRMSADFLKQAEKARDDEAAALRAQNRLLEEELVRVTELRKLLAQGRLALRAGDLINADRAFEEAARLGPNDPGVLAARRELNTVRLEIDARRKLLAEHQALLKVGYDALQAKRYDDAIKSLTAARQLVPDDKAGRDLLAAAIQQQEDARKAFDADRKKREDEQRAAKVRDLVRDGRAALAKGQLQAADQAFDAAALLAPNDPSVLQARRDLQAALKDAGARAKLQADYQAFLKTGRDALQAKRFDDAINAFSSASRLLPENRTAKDLHAEAIKQRDAAVKAGDAAKKLQEEQQRAMKVRDLLNDGQVALGKRQYQTAERAFNDARQLAPNDPKVREALQQLDQARKLGGQFTLGVDAAVTIAQGGKARVRVSVDRKGNSGYQGPVDVELRGLPSGVSASKATIPPGQAIAILELSAANNAKLGADRNVQAIGAGRGLQGNVNSPALTVTVLKK